MGGEKKKPTWALCASPNISREEKGHAHFACFTACLCALVRHATATQQTSVPCVAVSMFLCHCLA